MKESTMFTHKRLYRLSSMFWKVVVMFVQVIFVVVLLSTSIYMSYPTSKSDPGTGQT
jgi:hypothetical protein